MSCDLQTCREFTELFLNDRRVRLNTVNSLRKESPDNLPSFLDATLLNMLVLLLFSELTIKKEHCLKAIGLGRVDLHKISPSKEESSHQGRSQDKISGGLVFGEGFPLNRFVFFTF